MSTRDTQSLKPHANGQGKDSNKKEQLKAYVKQSKYIDILEQPKVCNSFGLPYLSSVFEREYTNRFIGYLNKKPSSRFEVFKATGIPEKYLCQVKKRLENNGKLKVLYCGYCNIVKKHDIQILSTNPKHWNNLDLLPDSNQLKMF